VVAEKTGYPVDMLELTMGLESDLGIDSIKRVEILSALEERLPDTTRIQSEQVGSLQTLAEVAETLLNGQKRNTADTPPPRIDEESPPVDSSRPLERSVLTAVPLRQRPDGDRIRVPAGGRIWVTEDGSDLSARLMDRLRSLDFRVQGISLEEGSPLSPPDSLQGLVILAPEKNAGDAFLKKSFLLLKVAGSALRSSGPDHDGLFVTVSRMDGAFNLKDPAPDREAVSGGLAGLAKTVHAEWPEVKARALDLARGVGDPDEAAALVIDEMFRAGPMEVGISREGVCSLALTPSPHATTGMDDAGPLEEGDVILISGGGRGVTAEAAVAVAGTFHPTLVLLGRSQPPEAEPDWLAPLEDEAGIKRELLSRMGGKCTPKELEERFRHLMVGREIRCTLERIEATGARVEYRSVDVLDAAAVQEVLASVQASHGPVRGLIHGAGVLADRTILDKTPDQFDLVYDTKVCGLRHLLQGIDAEDLKMLVLFSSSSGRFGRAGQVDYAVANEVLNKTASALARRNPGCRTVSLNWGPWDGGMVTPSLRTVFQKEGIGLIPLAAGADFLTREIRTRDQGSTEVVVMGSTAKEPAAPEGVLAFERQLDIETCPVLRSHVIDNRAVLPKALILEWLAHAALHCNPGLQFHGFNELRLLKGLVLESDASFPIRVMAGRAEQEGDIFTVLVELYSTPQENTTTLHASAEIVLVHELPQGPPPTLEIPADAYPRDKQEIYEKLLFHGAELQGIEKVEACSDQGIQVRCRTAPPPSTWLRNPLRNVWLADPLVLDCSFQAMVLWTFEQLGAFSLPSFSGRYRQFRKSFSGTRAGGEIRITARITRSTRRSATADIELVDGDGCLVARLTRFECTITESLKEAFRQNKLSREILTKQ